MSTPQESKISEQYGVIIDPNLGIYADQQALSKEQRQIYFQRNYDKARSWVRLDLLPYESFKFHHLLQLTEYYLNAQREKTNKEISRFGTHYTTAFVQSNIEPFYPTLFYNNSPYLQTMLLNYYRSKNDSSHLVNYMKRTLRKLSQYGLFQSESTVAPLPFDVKKKQIKTLLLANSQKLAKKLKEREHQAYMRLFEFNGL